MENEHLANAPIISADIRSTAVRVIHTDEEWIIAKTISQILNLNFEMEHKHENKKSI